jgi:prolyl-tRNA editing enzyme YbaK/EbsC (Cys-tRNA(Pro) deacylase)
MIPEKVRRILTENDLVAMEFSPGSTPTSEAAAQQIGVQVGQIAKSMVLKAKTGYYYLVICPGNLRICNKKAKKIIGSRVRMAQASETEQVTGFKPGGVCPFGMDNLDILIDERLAQYQTIYPAAGNDASGVAITFSRLQTITAARVVDIMLDNH